MTVHLQRRLTPMLVALVLGGCVSPDDVSLTRHEWERLSAFRLISSPTDMPDSAVGNETHWNDDAAADFGQLLYFDPGLSRSGETSCNTCHDAQLSGADPRGHATSLDDAGSPSLRNAPTVYNAGLRKAFSWTSRRELLWVQIAAPLTGPFHGWTTPDTPPGTAEMEIEAYVCANYAGPYTTAFGQPGEDPSQACTVRAPGDTSDTFDNITRAIAAYVRRLESVDSNFDRFIGEDHRSYDTSCMPDDAIRGAKLFVGRAHCDECHNGPTFSDGKRYYLGIGDQFEQQDGQTVVVRYQTPPLRQIAHTGPYMHDGSLDSLSDVLEFYRYGGGDAHVDNRAPEMEPLTSLTDRDLLDLEAFLEQLDGHPLDYCLTHAPHCCTAAGEPVSDDPSCPAPLIRPDPLCP